ncbi:hypothetical protein [Bdellovibrio bacteriovorus]|uniref:hypothetical protein n=1 Tax=Bdellovibrio bacteriovorus TaxID=959 RepID=UPI003D06872F
MARSKILMATSVLLITLNSYAGESGMSSAYSFGGACASQGVWTQTALANTQELRRITLQLRDDPNCKALGASVQSAVASLEEQVKMISDTPQRASRLSQLPNEISALRNFLISSPDMKGQVLQLMMNRSIESATLGAQVQQDATSMASGMTDFNTRLQRGANTGLQLTNQVIDSIPLLEECLTDSSSTAFGNYIAAAVKVVSSFASSGEGGSGSNLATTISKITGVMRNGKYASVLKKLNQQEFTASMACLMEVTTESYCHNRDGMSLFQKGMEDVRVRSEDNNKVTPSNPFAGYYVLNTHVPNVTKWLQKIQIGVDPKLPTDAEFQNKILQEVTEFYKGVKVLLGDYNTAVITIKSMPTLLAKQNAVLKLIGQIESSMNGGSRFGESKTNFFTMSRTPITIPFDLIGMPTPDQVLGKTFPKLAYDEWLQANMTSLPMFQDPVVLAETIGNNMKQIVQEANISAIEYFNKWYIVDKSALVNESMIDINYTVKDSLTAINQYLEHFKERSAKYDGDASILPAVVDTQVRIKKILDAYQRVENQGRLLAQKQDLSHMTPEQIDAMSANYEALVNTVYAEFNVMLSRSGFLANRMVNFVYQDYILLVKNKVNFTEYQQELFVSSGMAAFDKMLQTYNGNPAQIQNDLNMGLRINLGNIEALEALLKNSVISAVADLKQVENGKPDGFFSRYGRILQDMVDDKEVSPAHNIFSVLPKSLYYWFKNSDRYAAIGNTSGPQSEFDDARYVRSQMCIQGLAFVNQTGLQNLCQDAVLKSPIPGADVEKYNVSYAKELHRNLNAAEVSKQMQVSLNRSSRICAFRDFNRRNMVLFMTLGKTK